MEEAMQPERLYRVPEAAHLLGLKPSALRKRISTKRISVIRLSCRAVRIPESELVRLQREGLCPRVQP